MADTRAPHIHIIPVPDGCSAEDAFAEIVVMGRLVDHVVTDDGDGGHWATVACDGRCGL